MNLLRLRPFLLFFACFILLGCSSADPPEITRGTSTGGLPVTSEATGTETAETISTPIPMETADTQTSLPTRTPLPNTPTPTVSPTLTPTLYPNAWVSGILWYETNGEATINVGNSSVGIHGGLITYEPLNEVVAAEIARYSFSTLVVFYGDYRPQGEEGGRIVVERVEPVNLPFTEVTQLSEMYIDPENRYSFAYPGRWTLRIYDSEDYLSLRNRPSDSMEFGGPGIEYIDPTAIEVVFRIVDSSIEAYLQDAMDTNEQAMNADPDYSPTVTTSLGEFNGLPVTQLEIDQLVYSNFGVTYLIALDNDTTLAISTSPEGKPVTERILETLTLN